MTPIDLATLQRGDIVRVRVGSSNDPSRLRDGVVESREALGKVLIRLTLLDGGPVVLIEAKQGAVFPPAGPEQRSFFGGV